MSKTRLAALALCALMFLLPACAEEDVVLPAWEYPVPPAVLLDVHGYLVLCDKEAPLTADDEPGDLVAVTAKRVNSSMQLRKEANDALNAMFQAAAQDGYTLYVKSDYRSYQTQRTMYYNRLEKVGHDDGVVAFPGTSDHQTGLGVDILNYEWTRKGGMNANFGKTDEARWMAAHCMEYGFILRYPEGKEDVTGIIYEPWHLRYVGPEAAQYISAQGMVLEEFTTEWRAYVASFEALGMTLEAYCRALAAPPPVRVLQTQTPDGDEEVSMFYD